MERLQRTQYATNFSAFPFKGNQESSLLSKSVSSFARIYFESVSIIVRTTSQKGQEHSEIAYRVGL